MKSSSLFNRLNNYLLLHFLNIGVLLTYCVLFYEKNDLYLIITFFSSLLIGFSLEAVSTKRLFANSSAIILLLFLFLYGFFNVCIDFLIFGEVSKDIYFATLIYGLSLPSYNLGLSVVRGQDYSIYYERTLCKDFKKKFSYSLFLILPLIILLIFRSYYLWKQQLLFNPGVLKETNRIDLFKEISQSWVVSGYLISGIFLYFIFYYKNIQRRLLIIITLLFTYYVAMQLCVGNRRDFSPMIVGIFWVFVNTKKMKLNISSFIVLLLSIFIFLSISTLRSSPESTSIFSAAFIYQTLSSNEFVYPFYTLTYAVHDFLNGNLEYLYGKSLLLNSITIFIPRILIPWKPNSLASDFVMDNFGGGMGYAYTPITELFINFGILGPAVFFFLLGLLLKKVQTLKDQRLIFLFFVLIPDFCRGEISSFIYQLLISSLFVFLIPGLLLYRKKSNVDFIR
ncbi:O-antigen polymerase [Desertivirga brevis]|uniref:O-antigen polymerase n=1 Tax=Desertivirga brevis TaxID=2810310 RepID=UPI001A9611BB